MRTKKRKTVEQEKTETAVKSVQLMIVGIYGGKDTF